MPIAVGLKVQRPGLSFGQTEAIARAAEDAGFESIWGFDHLTPISGAECTESYTILAALAQATERVRLGTLVTSVGYRHPAVHANILATLDVISEGRVELGIGAGSKHLGERDYRAFGIPFHDYDGRITQVEEAATLIAELWSGAPVSFDGVFYDLHDAIIGVTPNQPTLPIVLGGSSERAVLAAVRCATDVNLSTGPDGDPTRLPTKLTQLAERAARLCAREGRNPATLSRSVQLFVADQTPREVGALIDAFDDAGATRVVLVPGDDFTTVDVASLGAHIP